VRQDWCASGAAGTERRSAASGRRDSGGTGRAEHAVRRAACRRGLGHVTRVRVRGERPVTCGKPARGRQHGTRTAAMARGAIPGASGCVMPACPSRVLAPAAAGPHEPRARRRQATCGKPADCPAPPARGADCESACAKTRRFLHRPPPTKPSKKVSKSGFELRLFVLLACSYDEATARAIILIASERWTYTQGSTEQVV
jgi:hypothetical protein